MLNVFTPAANAVVGGDNTAKPKVSTDASPEAVTYKWYEQPIIFILVLAALLVVVRFIERRVD